MPKNINQVIDRLDQVVAWSLAQRSTLGLFAAMYRQVTLRVAQGIQAGDFDDGLRMDRFDTVFAQRYLDALAAFQAGQQVSLPWRVAFTAPAGLLPMQHLLLGMNAHIGLDLPIAAARVGGAQTRALGRDFERINGILFSLIDGMQEALDHQSLLMTGLDRMGGTLDESLAAEILRGMREQAWDRAVDLSRLSRKRRRFHRAVLEQHVGVQSALIARLPPPLPVPGGLDLARLIAELDAVAQRP